MFKRLFGLFAMNPYVLGAIALAIAGAIGGTYIWYRVQLNHAYDRGFEVAKVQCKENELRAQRDELSRQLTSTNKQLQEMSQRERDRRSEVIILGARVKTLTNEIEEEAQNAEAQPNAIPCTYERIGPALRQRLQHGWQLGP